ncbi:alpha/beta fold hydrolase [Kineosporia succinea]|uniref:Pimeloyl-ACP methyl ester carboxylesterase n=1 Tax=Kineosporia succinea TaxID=84632 RepID=A0ABT9PCB5_9ACTN|nr:alpha/beta hydrolase [Kineosporia succinea]MDP9830347.1 pimeloyl-ACP methyl ester carboxylesterase [Kineosporia succinea]
MNSRMYVLVHGAWHTGEVWERVATRLEGQGHRVLTPTLTGYGETAHLLGAAIDLETHIDDIVGLLLREDLADVVLVGHSYAGMVISGVAHRVPERVGQLVYVDAMVPVDGENAVDVMPVTQHLIDAAARGATPWRIPPLPEMPAPAGLFGVTDPDDVAWLKPMVSDHALGCLTGRVRMGNPAADRVPSTHIHCVGSEPEGFERRPVPATVPPARVHELRSGHDCMVIVPDQVSALLLGV